VWLCLDYCVGRVGRIGASVGMAGVRCGGLCSGVVGQRAWSLKAELW
jgi:hypothetical protein